MRRSRVATRLMCHLQLGVTAFCSSPISRITSHRQVPLRSCLSAINCCLTYLIEAVMYLSVLIVSPAAMMAELNAFVC